MEALLEFLGVAWRFEIYRSPDDTVITLGQLLLVLLLVVLGIYGGRIIRRTVARRLAAAALQRDAAHAIEQIVFYLVIVGVVMLALGMLRIPLTAFAFISGAVAIGIGFGAQNILNNFISGWILMSERPVRIGDVVEIDGAMGNVEGIGARSTRIRRADGVHLLVPNSQLLEQTVINWTLIDPNIRTSIRVGVAYGSPVRKVEALIMQAVREQPEVLAEPEPQVVFEDFGDSALIFDAFFWSDVGSERPLRSIRSAIRFRITELFEEHDIAIPFPQRDVHLISASDGSRAIVERAVVQPTGEEQA